MTAPNCEEPAHDPLDEYMAAIGADVTAQRSSWFDDDDEAMGAAAAPPRGLQASSNPGRRRSDEDIVRRNRRFEYCQRQLKAGDPFFQDAAMRERDSALYRELFGGLDPRGTPPEALARAHERLVRAFCERFLVGADSADVDYAAIDADARLDDLAELGRAAEERYFGDED